ncbi:Exocyst complex component Sec8 [Cordyceps militaris CM01]|uniref:Exocyst complex component Sec8 n=1 Tax=Cordyceps militaris (strain CM01) TaxID=983644 RepID=G3J9I6_CORMM|nr:Exocyst complex component Sec8 [Cordyceps militaris CM01]EGX94963.1 Exocyst complex component Sec8 [Cordyceps militaris CM01]
MSNRYAAPPGRGAPGYGNFGRSEEEYDAYGDDPRNNKSRGERYGSPSQGPPPPRGERAPSNGGGPPPAVRSMPSRTRMTASTADRQITQVLEHIRVEWPSLCSEDCIPVQLALQLLDGSSVGRAHDYRKFQETHAYVQDALKNTVHEHHQGFNSSIGTFHKIQSSIQGSQRRVRALKESLASATTSLCSTDPELKKLSETSEAYDDLLQTLNELDELRAVPDQLEARISEKRFLTAVGMLQNALRKLRRPELDGIGALSDLRSYLVNQETALMDILVEELHEHLYLKSPYCQERWQSLYKTQGAFSDEFTDTSSITPFHAILESMDIEMAVTEDPMKNPEADTFNYIALLVEALNKLGRLQSAVDTLKQRMPVELFAIANETNNEVDQRHPSSLRGGTTKSEGLNIYSSRETQMRAEVIHDLLWSLYGKFEAIGEGHRVFHESIKALIRREGAGNNSALLGSFKELWNLYQNEIRSLLRNYVTTDADVFQFDTPNPGGSLQDKKDAAREHLFKFAGIDAKSVDISTEYDALEGIVQATVPGLTGNDRKQGADKRRDRLTLDDGGTRRHTFGGYSGESKLMGTHKPLVEPSVFNMSLLLPPTLIFLQRLRTIVPPGSDLATSTLTTFLDNFLVNVFQPQLDETLTKLSDSILAELDSFAQDANWSQHSKLPIFKGTAAFFQIVTAFCRMLGTIPPDQALSSLLVTQMMRYYERCFDWYKLLVTKTQEQTKDANNLRASARFAVQPGEIHEVMKQMWLSDEEDKALSEKEIHLLIEHTNESRLEPNDIIQDRETITSLCLLYTSMKWLATRITGLRHITAHEMDSSRQSMTRQANRRWTLMNEPSKSTNETAPVVLPLTVDTVQTFDNLVSSYEELAGTALLTLHMEVRCRIVHSLRNTLSPDVAPYLLEQEVREPDPAILSLNLELVLFDETVARYLRAREVSFIRTGLSLLISSYLVGNAGMASPINARGSGRMRLNILVLQQNLKNVEQGVDLARAANYYALLDRGADAVVAKAEEDRDKKMGEEAGATQASNTFTYEELKVLLELCMSEQMASPDRGLAAAAKRLLAEKLQEFSEKA